VDRFNGTDNDKTLPGMGPATNAEAAATLGKNM